MNHLNELIKSGLFGRGLIKVEHALLVARYNDCLQDMGLRKTALNQFQIDRFGWSPEIAEEQNNNYYLSHGEANPLAIILIPEQENSPIYFPMHSFDWNIMEQWFSVNRTQIADLTRDSGIWLDLDQEVSLYRSPLDLTMVNEVIVRTFTPGNLMEKAQSQKELVFTWLNDKSLHFDRSIIGKLYDTAKADGDLRNRNFLIRDMQFSDVLDFYSRVFGGTFVLRSLNHEPIILTCDAAQVKSGVVKVDKTALDLLIKHGYIKTDAVWWKDHLYRLKVVAESFLVKVIDANEPELSFESINDIKKRQLVTKYKSELSAYFELNELYHLLKQGELPIDNCGLNIHLFHPSPELSASSAEVIWQLLTYIRGGRFVPMMYRYQKEAFIKAFTEDWQTPYRTWSLACVREYYDLLQMKR